MTIKSHPNVDEYFKEILFYNKPIEKLSIIKTNHTFKGYAKSFKVEIIEKKDLINQLEASKSSVKDLFRDLLNETKVLSTN